MELKCKEIEDRHGVMTKSIVCDFSNVYTISDYTKIVANEVKNLNVAMVFLNAGGSGPGTIYDLSEA